MRVALTAFLSLLQRHDHIVGFCLVRDDLAEVVMANGLVSWFVAEMRDRKGMLT
jgi:hypothetical protein